MADKKCAHPGCNCPVEKGEKQCSDYCKSMGKQPSMSCSCGHPGCTGQ